MGDLLAGVFERVLGVPARWGGSAPGRVNIIGEHTDYNDGFVMPIAISQRCFCMGAPRAAGLERNGNAAAGSARARPTGLGKVCTVSLPLESGPPDVRESEVDFEALGTRGSDYVASLGEGDRWARYVVGVFELFGRACAARGNPAPGPMDILVGSDVPVGAGLSSSASLEVAVCTMLEQASGVRLEKIEKARLCQRAEHEYAGVPCGIMDQYASIYGEAGRALLLDCRSCTHTPVVLPGEQDAEGGAALVVVNSNVHHDLAMGEYAKRRRACADAAAMLGARSLREVDVRSDRVQRAIAELPEDLYRVTMHVLSENQRTQRVAQACERVSQGRTTWKRALPEIGQIMVESHESLRDQYRVSCPELDALVEISVGARGVYGARMTGGGFGGCIVALVRTSKIDEMRETVEREYRRRTGKGCTAFVVKAGPGAAEMSLH